MSTYSERLDTLEERIGTFADNLRDAKRETQNDEQVHRKIFSRIAKELCTLGREAEQDSNLKENDLNGTLDRVEELLCRVVGTCNDEDLTEHIESFAHTSIIKPHHPEDDANEDASKLDDDDDENEDQPSNFDSPLVRDTRPFGVFEQPLLRFFTMFADYMRSDPEMALHINPAAPVPKPLPPWWEVARPRLSSRLSRFRPNLPASSATDATPRALNLHQARCEVNASSINLPIRIFSHFSSTESILAIPSMGGWKNRTPILKYLIDAEPVGSTDNYTTSHSFTVGLADIAYHSAIDPSRKLLFTGDDDRVKSFEWGTPGTEGNFHAKARPIHTFNSNGFNGPMIVLGDGRFIRAGKGKMGVWNLNELNEETHSGYGKKPLGGRKISTEDTWRDDPEAIEPSQGTTVGQTINLWIPNLKPGVMKPHPSGTSNLVLFGAEFDRDHDTDVDPRSQYSCVTLDIEQGKPVSKILGHGDEVTEFSTSGADPNIFATGCGDSYARLFDVRTHFPIMTFDATNREEECGAVALAYPDGIPSLFTGRQRGECIKFWDIRAKAAVYDLGTGNNSVSSLAWDERKQVLYATTFCDYITRHGDRVDYRKLRIPRPPKSAQHDKKQTGAEDQEMEDEEEDEDDNMDEEDEEEDENLDEHGDYIGRGWPRKAQHAEDYYPHVFDAASHRFFRYTFKEEPNLNALPRSNF